MPKAGVSTSFFLWFVVVLVYLLDEAYALVVWADVVDMIFDTLSPLLVGIVKAEIPLGPADTLLYSDFTWIVADFDAVI